MLIEYVVGEIMRRQFATDAPLQTTNTQAAVPHPRHHAGGHPDVIVNPVRLRPVIDCYLERPVSFSGTPLSGGLSFGFGPVKISGVCVEAAINAEIALGHRALEIDGGFL
jgi:hypothetical protein